jgi:hypothetical protein
LSAPPADPESPDGKPSGRGGLRLRIAATAALVGLAGLSASRFASAAFDEASAPIGDVASLDGIISGTVRLTGDRLVFYSGDRFESNKSNLALNFANGGSLILCPHSQVQILAAGQNAGIMLAFQDGGSEQPFPVRPNDVIMTPDWRVELQGNVRERDTTTLQISTGHRGELCLSGNLPTGGYFRVSELLGDSVFNVTGQSSIRITPGHIENSPGGCTCATAADGATEPSVQSPAAIAAAPVATAKPQGSDSPASTLAATTATTPATDAPPTHQTKQRPQDVAGYVHSFIHLIFGR